MPCVLIVHQFAIPPTRSGGTRHHALAKGLVEKGFEVVVMASSSGYGLAGGGQAAAEETLEGVRYLYVRQNTTSASFGRRFVGMLEFASRVLGARKRLASTPDIVLGSSPSLFGAFAAALLARRLRIPFVLEVRDLWPLSLVEILRMSAWHPVVLAMKAIERWLYRSAEAVVSPLEHAADHIQRVAGKPCRVVVLPNGIDPRLWNEVSMEASERLGKRFTAVYAGSHGPPNALDVYVEAARCLRDCGETDIAIRLVGDGIDRQRLIDKAKTLGLDNIEFGPPIPKQEMGEVLRAADAFLINIPDSPLYVYGFSPNKVFDYMYAGRPLVMGTAVQRNPVSRSGGGVVIPPNDPEAVAHALTALRDLDDETRRQMGERARHYVLEHHNMERLSADLAALLESLLRGV